MAATSKPVREKIERAEALNRKTTNKYLPNKSVAKMSIKKHHKTLK
jgi:hypothetical protein